MMALFPDKLRDDLTYANPGERTYSFLNRSGLQQFKIVREKLNEWFSYYPLEEQYELKKRLQSQWQFNDAFFELYIHELFFKRGYHLAVHPQLINSTKQPDFLVSNESGEKFYLEVKVVHDESDDERNYKEKQYKIAQEFNKLGNFPFWISIRHLKLKNEGSFSVKPILKSIEKAARKFDYLRMMERTAKESLCFKNENFDLELGFWPRSSSRIEGVNPAVGMYGYYNAGYVNTHKALEKAIEEKAKKYGKLDYPYIIALNCISPDHIATDDLELIIGKDYKFIRSNKSFEQANKTILNEGIFSKPFMNNIAALFLTFVTPYHENNEQWYWCENPNFNDKKLQRSIIDKVF